MTDPLEASLSHQTNSYKGRDNGTGSFAVPFRLLTYDDLMCQRDPAWLIDGVLPEGFAVLYSAPETFKTFVAIDWAMSIATGLPWHGREVRQGFVVYVAAEGRSGLRKRVAAWVRDRHPQDLSRVRFLPDAVDLLDGVQVERVRLSLATLPEPPALLVIDTMARTMLGGDENAAKDVGRFIHAVDAQSVVGRLVVHHTSKDGTMERGSGALRGAADLMVRLERDGQSPRVTVECDKAKDFERWAPITLEHRSVGDSLVFDQLGWFESASAVAQDRRIKVLAFIGEYGPVSKNKIEQGVGGNAALTRTTLDMLETEGAVTVTRSGQSKRYELPRPSLGDEVGTR